MNRNLKTLPELYERQLDATNKLEKAETNLLGAATKAKLKADKGSAKVGFYLFLAGSTLIFGVRHKRIRRRHLLLYTTHTYLKEMTDLTTN